MLNATMSAARQLRRRVEGVLPGSSAPALLLLLLLPLLGWLWPATPAGWLGTAEQRAARCLRQQNWSCAARLSADPWRRGDAWYRAGEFRRAAAAYAAVDTAEGHFNRGNALLMLGDYPEAMAAYTQALQLREAWDAAAHNRALAEQRLARLRAAGDAREAEARLAADDTVLRPSGDPPAQAAAGQDSEPYSSAELEALLRERWLRRAQQSPADFLRLRFLYQLQREPAVGEGAGQ